MKIYEFSLLIFRNFVCNVFGNIFESHNSMFYLVSKCAITYIKDQITKTSDKNAGYDIIEKNILVIN